MNTSNAHNQRIAMMTFASVYPLYIAKVEKKGRKQEDGEDFARLVGYATLLCVGCGKKTFVSSVV